MTPTQINLYCYHCESERTFSYVDGYDFSLNKRNVSEWYECQSCNTVRMLRKDNSRREMFLEEEIE
jgi:hypothetical protein